MTLLLTILGIAIGLASVVVAFLQLNRTPKLDPRQRRGLSYKIPLDGNYRTSRRRKWWIYWRGRGLKTLVASTAEATRPADSTLEERRLGSADVLSGRNDGFSVTAAGVLVGRDSEMAMLTRLVRQVGEGQGGRVLIEGEPGIGKSALMRAALGKAADARCQVFWGAGDELGQDLPLLPLIDALRIDEPSIDPRRNRIVDILRGHIATDRGADVSAGLAQQLLALVAEQCAVRPTVLVVDDLQWADRASVALWVRLARSARQMPLLLAGMTRPVPQRDDLIALRRAVGDDARLRLSGLTTAAVAELVGILTGGKPDDELLRLADGAAGNPLFVTELVAALKRSSSVRRTETGTATLTAASAPGSLSAAIEDRLSFVSVRTRDVLQAAALLGADFAVRDLAIVLGSSVADLIPALNEARSAGVLTESGTRLGFRHDLIRSALYEAMPVSMRTAWHGEAGRALAEAGAPADRVARQLQWAVAEPGSPPEPVDEWVLSWLANTADLLVARAPQVAAELLRRAVAGVREGSARGFLVSRLADALYRVGNVAEAEQVANQALARELDTDLVVDLQWTLAQCRTRAGEYADTLATLDRALALPGISARHRGRLLVLTARAHSQFGDFRKASGRAR